MPEGCYALVAVRYLLGQGIEIEIEIEIDIDIDIVKGVAWLKSIPRDKNLYAEDWLKKIDLTILYFEGQMIHKEIVQSKALARETTNEIKVIKRLDLNENLTLYNMSFSSMKFLAVFNEF